MIVALVFFREFLREEVEVGFADDFLERPAQFGAEFRVAEGEAPVLVLAQNVLRERFHERVV